MVSFSGDGLGVKGNSNSTYLFCDSHAANMQIEIDNQPWGKNLKANGVHKIQLIRTSMKYKWSLSIS